MFKMHGNDIPVDRYSSREQSPEDEQRESSLMRPKTLTHDGVPLSCSEGTAKGFIWLDEFWKIVDMIIVDDIIEKDDWDFLMKCIDRKNPVLEQKDAEFLFVHLEDGNSGYTTKGILKTFLRTAVREINKEINNKPTNREIFQMAFQHAVNDEKLTQSISYQFKIALINANSALSKLMLDMKSLNENSALIHDSIDSGNPSPFPSPQIIYDKHLKEHQGFIDKYVTGSLKKRYEGIKSMLNEAEKQYEMTNSNLAELVELRERDSRCCKFFGCLCPC